MPLRCVSLSIRGFLIGLGLLISCATLSAQATVTVSGTVTDGSAPLSSVTVDFFDSMHVRVASASTDTDGRYSVQMPTGTYDVVATPPPLSGLAPATLTAQPIDSNTTINIVLVAPVRRTLSGRVLDGSGVGISGATLNLTATSGFYTSYTTQTDASGQYLFEVPSGTYRIEMSSYNSQLDQGRPQFVHATVWQVPLDADRLLDFALPLHELVVHVQHDTTAVGGVGISASGSDNCSVVFSGLMGCVGSSYTYSPIPMPPMPGIPTPVDPVTNESGDFRMWLVATGFIGPATPGYTVTATPPADSGLVVTAMSGIAIPQPSPLIINLQAPLSLTGKLFDASGAPIGGASINLTANQPGPPMLAATTADDGSYGFQVSPGNYRLELSSYNPALLPNRPQFINATIWQIPIGASRVLDIVLPVHRVDVRVERDGAAIAGVGLSASGYSNCELRISDLQACVGSTYTYSSMPPMPGIPVAAQPVTDANGEFTMWLAPTGTPGPATPGYTIAAMPPAELSLPATLVPNVQVTADMPLTITLVAPVQLTGRISDAAGAAISGATVNITSTSPGSMIGASTTTGADGIYRFEVSPGHYRMEMSAWNGDLVANRPQFARLTVWDIPLEASRALDLPLPFYRVQVHAQDAGRAPVAGVGLSVSGSENCQIRFSDLYACVGSSYSYSTMPPMPGIPPLTQPATDADGNFTMWLVPSGDIGPATPGYTLNATPGADTPFRPFSLVGVAITEPTQILISMQFVHDPPVTEAALSPAPGSNGEYSDPVTVTLLATAAAGYTIDRVQYQIDGGSVQAYAGPFAVSGGGAHELRFWATDNTGVYEPPKVVAFTIRSVPTLESTAEALGSFCASGDIGNPGVCNSLNVKLRAAVAALARGNDDAMRRQLGAFLNELAAQRGKHVAESAYTRLDADVRLILQ